MLTKEKSSEEASPCESVPIMASTMSRQRCVSMGFCKCAEACSEFRAIELSLRARLSFCRFSFSVRSPANFTKDFCFSRNCEPWLDNHGRQFLVNACSTSHN